MDCKGEKKELKAERIKNLSGFYGFFFVIFFYMSSVFILYASFLDFFGTDLGLDRLGFCFECFCTIFLVGGRSFPFWLLFIRYWVSLVSYTWGFMSDAFLRFCLWEGLFFFSHFVCCPVPSSRSRGWGKGKDGKIELVGDSVPGDGSDMEGEDQSASLCCRDMFCMEHGDWKHGHMVSKQTI